MQWIDFLTNYRNRNYQALPSTPRKPTFGTLNTEPTPTAKDQWWRKSLSLKRLTWDEADYCDKYGINIYDAMFDKTLLNKPL